LIVEDSLTDTELMLYELRPRGSKRIGAWILSQTISPTVWDFDVIISDFNMPQFDALRALQLYVV